MLVDALHGARRLAVHRLARDRPLRRRTSARRSSPFVDARFRTLPAGRPPRPAGQVVGRVRGRWSGRMLPARPLRRRSRRTRATRCSRSRSRRSFAAAAQALRNRYGGSFERFWADFRSGRPVLANSDRPRAALRRTRNAGRLLAEPGRLGRAALPARHRRARARGLGALARAGTRCGWRRSTARRSRAARDLDRRRPERRVPPRPRRGGVPRGGVARRACADEVVRFELFEGTHRGTNWRYPLSLAFLAERLRPRRPVDGQPGAGAADGPRMERTGSSGCARSVGGIVGELRSRALGRLGDVARLARRSRRSAASPASSSARVCPGAEPGSTEIRDRGRSDGRSAHGERWIQAE